jgi:hypothetical protein
MVIDLLRNVGFEEASGRGSVGLRFLVAGENRN